MKTLSDMLYYIDKTQSIVLMTDDTNIVKCRFQQTGHTGGNVSRFYKMEAGHQMAVARPL